MLLSRQQVRNVFDMSGYISAVENVFRLYGEGKVEMPPKLYLTFPNGDLRCMPAYIPSMKIAGVKNVNVHPDNLGLPSVMATITLFDPETGFPLAIMDGTHITNMRTGAAGGVAAKYLSREDSKTASFIGAGEQAKTQLEALLVARPGIEKIIVYDPDMTSLEAFDKHAEKIGFCIGVEWASSIELAVREADILTTTTPSRSPVVKAEWVQPGTHINAIGADAKGKQEVEDEVLRHAKIVIDDWKQASHSGEINVPVSKGLLKKENVHADIGEIMTGKKAGRENPEEVTVFDSTGLAIQDIACAVKIYEIYGSYDNDKIYFDRNNAEKFHFF
jgi:alanine dehydrogenase